MPEVNDAVILAGGLGTRMLPASLFMPKETLPLVDTPVINHLIWEGARAGIRRVHLVLSERKFSILEEFFENDTSFPDEIRPDMPREVLRMGPEEVTLIPHIQENAGGVADAISTAISEIDGAFLVLLGDMLLMDNHVSPQNFDLESASNASKKMVSEFEINGLPSVGIYPVEDSELSKYGVVELSEEMVVGIVEKPLPEEAPSNYVLCGRYILPQNTKEILRNYPISEFGELQSIHLLLDIISDVGLQAIKMEDMELFDSGDPLAWLKSQINHSLKRDDLSNNLTEWLYSRLK